MFWFSVEKKTKWRFEDVGDYNLLEDAMRQKLSDILKCQINVRDQQNALIWWKIGCQVQSRGVLIVPSVQLG